MSMYVLACGLSNEVVSALRTQDSLVPEDVLEAIDQAFHRLPLAIDFVRPLLELVVRDRRRLVEMLLVEENPAENAAEDSDGTVVRGRGAVEEHFVPRA